MRVVKKKYLYGIFFICLLVLLIWLAIVGAHSFLIPSATVSNRASVRWSGMEVYWDYARTRPVSYIDWGAIDAGGSVSSTFFLYNSGTNPINVTVFTENWVPSDAENYMQLNWVMSDTIIYPKNLRGVTLTLSVSINITQIENFSFDITFVGGELE